LKRFQPWNAFHGSNGSCFEPELARYARRRASGRAAQQTEAYRAARGALDAGGLPHGRADRPISAYPPADQHPATMPASTNAPVYRVRGLTRIYRMGEVEIHALRGVDLDLYEGEFVVLLGASGSGKSTLLNILGGLDRASAGEVLYRGQDLGRADAAERTRFRRREAGFVFQFYNLIASLTALENVAIVTEIAERPMDPAEALRLVGLEERMNHFPAQLSGGEQQRVAIARAIAKNPSVLLCDEPTGALDSRTGVRVLAVLADVNRRLGTTTVVITHNAVIAEMADRVVRLSDGRVAEVRVNEQRLDAESLQW